LERRRLQCYLALLLGDIIAIYAGFLIPGSLYLGETGPGQASRISDLILPLFLTVALYNGSYSHEALQQSRIGAMRAVHALAIAAALTIFIAFYTKSSAEFSRVLFGSGTIAAAIALIGLRYQMDRFIAWHCGGTVTSQLVIRDEGPPIELPGAHHIDLATFGIVPALNDPVSLHRIGLLLAGVDRVTVSCPSGRRATWATILRSVNIEGEVTDETVTQLAAHGARLSAGVRWTIGIAFPCHQARLRPGSRLPGIARVLSDNVVGGARNPFGRRRSSPLRTATGGPRKLLLPHV